MHRGGRGHLTLHERTTGAEQVFFQCPAHAGVERTAGSYLKQLFQVASRPCGRGGGSWRTDAASAQHSLSSCVSARLRSIRRRIKQLEGKTINAADGPVASNRDVVTVRSEAGGGNAADYLTARLKRDHDAIFQRLAAGEFTSVRQAAIAAGIVVMIDAGLAWHYTRYSDDADLAAAERAARAARRGLWADPEPVPPWEWRGSESRRDAVRREPAGR